MIELSLALVLCWGTWRTLQGGFVGPGRGLQVVGIESQGLAMGALAVLAAGYFYGTQFGAALILMVVIHEFGRVAAFRVCGRSDARFRLIPLFGGVAISDRLPASDLADFFIAVMGAYQGYNSSGGALGVGRATTNAVVGAIVLILAVNYLITAFFVE